MVEIKKVENLMPVFIQWTDAGKEKTSLFLADFMGTKIFKMDGKEVDNELSDAVSKYIKEMKKQLFTSSMPKELMVEIQKKREQLNNARTIQNEFVNPERQKKTI